MLLSTGVQAVEVLSKATYTTVIFRPACLGIPEAFVCPGGSTIPQPITGFFQ